MEFCQVLQRELYEPVLAGDAEESSPRKFLPECCRRAIRWMRLSLCDWWADSMSKSYLDSTLSRRRFWHISLPLASAFCMVSDLIDGANNFPWITVFIYIAWILVSTLMPRQHLKADFVMSSVMALCGLCGLLATRNGHMYLQFSNTRDSQEGWAWGTVTAFLFSMCLGMHSTATIAALLALMLISITLAPVAVPTFATGAGLAATTGVISEALLAAAHKHHVALETVLNGCTDGIVCVSVPAGIIGSASGKMQDVWFEGTSSGASGVDFKDYLHPDDAGQWEEMLDEARNRVPRARLVTCQTVLLDSVKTVDCRIVPYLRRQDELWFCCHIVGEARTAPHPGAPAVGAGQGPLASVEEETDQEPPTAVVQRDGVDADVDAFSAVGRRDQAAPDTLSPHGASNSPLQLRTGTPSLRAGSELTYSITEISAPNPKVKLDASTQTPSSFSQARARPPRPPRAPVEPLAAGIASSSSEVWAQGRQLHVSTPKRKVLPHYAETPPTTQALLLLHACFSMNARGRGCCPWHISIRRLQTALEKMRDGACQRNFLPHGDWQCANCLALNVFSEEPGDAEMCGTCGRDQVAVEHNDTDSGELGGSEGAHRAPTLDPPAQ